MKKANFDFVNKDNMCLFTDLYELTMCASYFQSGKNEPATFDLFIRKLPSNRSYFIFAGLEQAVLFLETVKFNEEQITYLRKQGFKEEFLNYLGDFRFSGEVWAVPEGTVVFPDEPLIRITAPIIEAQLVESFLLNTVNLQTMIATKASRVVHAAAARPVIEFGLRRTQGTDAGMKAARCSYMAGCAGTSNELAGMTYGIPIFGTMAHSYVMFFDSELEAFKAFVKTFPKNSTLLIDTYDDLKGAENAAVIAETLRKEGGSLVGVRLDSGDLFDLSRKVRTILDSHGLRSVQIFASGDLDEYKVDMLVKKGARIDAFGVGTRMSVSFDRPYVDVVYKLAGKVEKGEFLPAMKLSKGKMTLPGRKQGFRQRDDKGGFLRDIISLEDEEIRGEPLLLRMMSNGKMIHDLPTLEQARRNTAENISNLPCKYKKLRNASRYPVLLSPKLREIKKQLSTELRHL